MFIDPSLAAELIKLVKMRLMHLQLESNMILDDYKQCIKNEKKKKKKALIMCCGNLPQSS